MKAISTEHPILFSTPMVQAILEERKTMTRRIVKFPESDYPNNWDGGKIEMDKALFYNSSNDRSFDAKCQYGQPGDKLWVRETFEDGCMGGYIHKANFSPVELKDYLAAGYKWKPSIFMPKKAARIWLEITNIRVERLHDISEEDSKAEGAEFQLWQTLNNTDTTSYKNGFTSLWLHINGDDSWNANPWVWVIEFKRIEQ